MKSTPTIPAKEDLSSLLREAETGSVSPEKLKWLAGLLDHTLLKLDATEAQLRKHCDEAKQFGFFSVCVHPSQVKFCSAELKGSGVKTVSVAGFPVGDPPTEAKIADAVLGIESGSTEIDMVMQVGWLKERRLHEVFEDINQVVRACGTVPVKVILETCLLDQNEKAMASALAKAAGAAFLKTSTGFSTGGATESDVALLRNVAASHMGVKASGGVRSTESALRMVIAGANRIGTSSGVAIVSGKSPKETQSGVY